MYPSTSSPTYAPEWRSAVAPEHTWRKSHRSQNSQNCIELRNTLDQLRDSKSPTGSTLPANIPALVHTIQAGTFDR